MANSINTNISAYFAQANITTASNSASSSVARLSSGNRIVQAADDVAALSIGTALRTGVATLKVALTNASQGTSLLQVADGALAQVSEILLRQKAIAVQAASGSLDDQARSYLNAEFQSLSSQIDSLTKSTNFNGVKLINGTLSDSVKAATNTNNASAGSIQFKFTAVPADANTFIINGVTLRLKNTQAQAGDVLLASGANTSSAVQSIADYINNSQNDTSLYGLTAVNRALLANVKATADGDNLVITARTGGNLSQFFRVDTGSSGTFTNTVSGGIGAQRTSALTSAAVTATSIDADVSASSSLSTKFANSALIVAGATIYTVVAGDSLRKIVAGINASSATTGVTAYITGTSGSYNINVRTAATSTGTIGGAGLGGFTAGTFNTATTVRSLNGATDAGLRQGSVIGYGSTGDSTSLITSQSQRVNSSTIAFTAPTTLSSLSGQNVVVGGVTFTFSTNTRSATGQAEAAIGATLAESIDNLVEKINGYQGNTAENYALGQVEAVRDGNNLIIRTKQAANAAYLNSVTTSGAGTTDAVVDRLTITVFGSNIASPTNYNSGLSAITNTGIDAGGVTNAGFIGKIQGFSAVYKNAANTVDLSVVVGGITYRALNVNTAPTADGDIQFQSDTGGSFKVRLRGGQGQLVSNSDGATTYARALDAAFSGVTFSQKRDVSSYNATGSLIGSSFRLQAANFSNLNVDSVNVSAPLGSNPNAQVSFSINGELYTASNLGTQIGANSITRFVSASDPNKYLEFRNGANVIDLSNTAAAASFQTALKTAFGVGTGQAALSFQVGVTSDDSLAVSIGNATTGSLFNGATLSVANQASALTASTALDSAINTVTALRANVGALQSRFNYASAAIQVSVQNQDAARGQLLDTDIAVESTNFATYQVKLQAGISVLAQANQQLQNLLKLIQ